MKIPAFANPTDKVLSSRKITTGNCLLAILEKHEDYLNHKVASDWKFSFPPFNKSDDNIDDCGTL